MGIFQRGSPIVSVKKSTFFSNVFFSNIGLEIMFTYSLERKEAFGDDKDVNFFEVQKMGIFQRGSPMVLVEKSTFFSNAFFSNIGLEIMFTYSPERKEAFGDHKDVNFFLNSKKWVFSKGVHPWFWSKNPQFFLMCFSAK